MTFRMHRHPAALSGSQAPRRQCAATNAVTCLRPGWELRAAVRAGAAPARQLQWWRSRVSNQGEARPSLQVSRRCDVLLAGSVANGLKLRESGACTTGAKVYQCAHTSPCTPQAHAVAQHMMGTDAANGQQSIADRSEQQVSQGGGLHGPCCIMPQHICMLRVAVISGVSLSERITAALSSPTR